MRTVALLTALLAVSLIDSGRAQTDTSTLDVKRVAALPSLIGTPPASLTWSPDSRALAFRWNDRGWPFATSGS